MPAADVMKLANSQVETEWSYSFLNLNADKLKFLRLGRKIPVVEIKGQK